jgi:hypothetical protein
MWASPFLKRSILETIPQAAAASDPPARRLDCFPIVFASA